MVSWDHILVLLIESLPSTQGCWGWRTTPGGSTGGSRESWRSPRGSCSWRTRGGSSWRRGRRKGRGGRRGGRRDCWPKAWHRSLMQAKVCEAIIIATGDKYTTFTYILGFDCQKIMKHPNKMTMCNSWYGRLVRSELRMMMREDKNIARANTLIIGVALINV